MPPLDRSRFCFALAGEMLAREWNRSALIEAVRRVRGERSLRAPRIVGAVLGAFAQKPEYRELAAFLEGSSEVDRALAQAIEGPPRRTRRVILQMPQMGLAPARLEVLAVPGFATEGALAAWVGMEPRMLEWFADVSGRSVKNTAEALRHYRYRWIRRREGLPRLLEIPKARLKGIQRRVLAEILEQVPVHAAAHGFIVGRSAVSNAAMHCGKPAVLRFDLADFFPSVTAARVFRIFRTIGYPDRVARLLMGLCTTRMPGDVWETRPGPRSGADFEAGQRLKTRHLPQGAPTSPALANLAAMRLDRRLAGLARSAGLTYTRYADDLTFSGGENLLQARHRLEARVGAVALEEGFRLNHRKTRLQRQGVRQQVTGVVVNVRLNVGRAEFDRLKAMLTNCARLGPASQNREGVRDFRAHLAGKVAQIRSIHPSRGEKLHHMFTRIKW